MLKSFVPTMNRLSGILLFCAAAIAGSSASNAQAMFFESARVDNNNVNTSESAIITPTDSASQIIYPWDYLTIDDYLSAVPEREYGVNISQKKLPDIIFLPAVYDYHHDVEEFDLTKPDFSGDPVMRWIEEANVEARKVNLIKNYLFYKTPEVVYWNIENLPEPPKQFIAEVDPSTHTIEIREVKPIAERLEGVEAAPIKPKHWLKTFDASLQFSQAYVSPNWYQGGNNNLNMLANILYNVKLNPVYHPNLLFETTMQYKLGMNNAPDDSIHAYNISDDLFQLTSTFGLKAAKRWYYSVNALFKTQLLNSYKTNSNEMRSAFMSPGELNIGLGMTYNYVNPKKTVTFDASIAPLSYNLKTFINADVDPEKTTTNKFGSSAEFKFFWRLCSNITFNSRLFAFTDYSNAYADWENTLRFEINRFLTTQIYAHARYDTATPKCEDPDWKKLQIKEILSIGFAYKFSSL